MTVPRGMQEGGEEPASRKHGVSMDYGRPQPGWAAQVFSEAMAKLVVMVRSGGQAG